MFDVVLVTHLRSNVPPKLDHYKRPRLVSKSGFLVWISDMFLKSGHFKPCCFRGCLKSRQVRIQGFLMHFY